MVEERHSGDRLLTPLAKLEVADSTFIGFATKITGVNAQPSKVSEYHKNIKTAFKDATHVPYAWQLFETSDNTSSTLSPNAPASAAAVDGQPPKSPSSRRKSGYGEDGEPKGSTGPFLLEQVRQVDGDGGGGSCEAGSIVVVVIVRYFGSQLLGVTCGRLSQCYTRIAHLTLHRLIHGNEKPIELDFTQAMSTLPGTPRGNVYGLAAGDTELHLNVIEGSQHDLMTTLLEELNFDGFKGADDEELPRLQNLQSDFYYNSDFDTTTIPVYRYPGNYHGNEWETFPWTTTCLEVKEKIEQTLPHFYNNQKMNHCVTNYYRNGHDFIAHHSDKDLDLNQNNAAIVSISIGSERILELKRRGIGPTGLEQPKDITRIVLPHGSMLLLGPKTNQYFTHSILSSTTEGATVGEQTTTTTTTGYDVNARISLTMRHVVTYMDINNGRLFGDGVTNCKTIQDLQRSRTWENRYFVFGFCTMWKSFWTYAASSSSQNYFHLPKTLLDALPWSTITTPLPRFSTITTALSSFSRTKSICSNSTISLPSSVTTSKSELKSIVKELVIVLGSGIVSYWGYSKFLKFYHRRKEEQSAREFFTKKSTSGTKY